ncbi:MAG: hypothetical protein ACERKD_13470 [Prolixibacteraceae bacterium]
MKNLENSITEVFNSFVDSVKIMITTNTLDYQFLPIPVKKKPGFKRR